MTATTLVTGGAGRIGSHTRHDLASILDSAHRWHVSQLAKA